MGPEGPPVSQRGCARAGRRTGEGLSPAPPEALLRHAPHPPATGPSPPLQSDLTSLTPSEPRDTQSDAGHPHGWVKQVTCSCLEAPHFCSPEAAPQ